MVNGEVTDTPIEGIEKITWIERYKGPSECIIVGDPLLLLNTLPFEMDFTSIQSQDIMVVEGRTIDESKPGSPKAEVRGRSSLWLAMDRTIVYPGPANDAILEGEHVNAIVDLIHNYLSDSWAIIKYLDDTVAFFTTGGARLLLEREALSSIVYDLLLPDDAGLKTIRPNPNRLRLETIFTDPLSEWYYDFGEEVTPAEEIFYVIYNGTNTGAEFNLNSGDDHKVKYSWSKRPIENLRYAPSGAKASIIEAVSTKDDPVYRVHYNVGDVVYIYGNYGFNGDFRVIEVATIEDKLEEKFIITFAPVYSSSQGQN